MESVGVNELSGQVYEDAQLRRNLPSVGTKSDDIDDPQ